MVTTTLALILTACGGSGTGVTGGTTPGTGTALDANATVTLALLGQIGTQTIFDALTSGPYSSSYCGSAGTSTTGNTTDDDNDGWVENAQTDFNCSAGVGTTSTVTGSLVVKDNDDTDPTSGFEEHLNNLEIKTTYSDGSGLSTTYGVDFAIQRATPGSNGQYNLTFDFNYSPKIFDSQGSTTDSQSIQVTGSPTFTPTSTSTPFDGGTFQFDTTVTFTVNGTTYNVTGTTSDLAYDFTTCQQGFNAGTLRYTDSQGNTGIVHYTGCDKGTYTFNGSAIGTF